MLYIYVHVCVMYACILFAFCNFETGSLSSTSYTGTHCVDNRTHRDPLLSAGNSNTLGMDACVGT